MLAPVGGVTYGATMDEIRMGIYQHYKGPLYQVIGLAHDANAGELYDFREANTPETETEPLGERTVVVYFGLQLDGAHLGPRLAVRTVEDFTAWVVPDLVGTRVTEPPLAMRVNARREGWVPRFEYLGPELTHDMLPHS